MQSIEQVLRKASSRFVLNGFFRGVVLFGAIAAGSMLVLRGIEKLTALSWSWEPIFWSALGVTIVGGGVLAWVTRPRGISLARAVDDAAGLRETISTAMFVHGREDSWSKAVVSSAEAKAKEVDVNRSMPIEAPRLWWVPMAMSLALLCVWWLPRYDLTGKLAQQQAEEENREQIELVAAEIKSQEEALKELVEKAGVDLGEEENDPFEAEAPEPRTPEDVRRTAVRKLTSVAERLQLAAENNQSGKTLQALNDKLVKLKTPIDGPASPMQRQLARGNFSAASQELSKLAAQMMSNEMSEAQREALAQQMNNLKDQLEALAENQEALEQLLRQAGMSAEQAQEMASNPSGLQQALQEMGLSQQAAQQLQQAAQSQQQASEAMNAMASAAGQMAEAAQQNAQGQQGAQQAMDAAQAMGDQLSAAEQMQQEMDALQNALSEAQQQLAQQGESMCENPGSGQPGDGNTPGQGQGGMGEWAAGQSNNQGSGSGGPGQGEGASPDAQATDFILKREKEEVENRGGPIIASTLVFGEQIKGESRATFSEVVNSSSARATEAIETRRVPREYREAVRRYFGQLEEAAGSSSGSSSGSSTEAEKPEPSEAD